MAFPAGLKFIKRRAESDGVAYFDCTREGHPPRQRRVRRSFNTRRERETYITRHDAMYHDELLAQQLGIERSPTLGEAVGDFMQHIRDLSSEGKRDAKTVHYYRGICEKLIEHFGWEMRLDKIGRKEGLEYAKKRRDSGSSSQGARFVKELKVVRRLQAFVGLNVVWTLPTDDISPVHRVRESIPIEDIRDFLRAMKPGSMEFAFATTKLITMLRNEELYAANVGDVVTIEDHGALEYTLRNKQTGAKAKHVTYLPAVLVAIIKPLTKDRKADAPLFHIKGRRLTAWSLRKRFMRASDVATAERRKLNPEARAVNIIAIGQFRHEGATIAIETLEATHPVSEHLDHKDERTTRKHYKLGKRASVLKQSKKVTETVASKLVN